MANTTRNIRYRDILRLTIPMLASFLLEMLIGITDVAFLGRYGETELAASALSGVFFLTILMLGFGYSWGAQAYMAQTNGEGNKAELGLTFQQTSIFLLALSFLLIFISFWGAPFMFDKYVTNEDVRQAALLYLLWRVIGLPFAFCCAAFRSFYVATLRPRVITYSSVVMVVVNCLLNYMLIFGIGPFPELGIAGAAIASAISEIVALIYFIFYAHKNKDSSNYNLFSKLQFSTRVQGILFRLGRWMMIQEAIACFTWLIFFVCIEHLGKEALALSNVLRQLCGLIYLFIHAFASTCGALSANLIGEGRHTEISSVMKKAFMLCVLSVILVEIFALISPETTMSIFTDIDELCQGPYTTYFIMLGSFVIGVPAVFAQFVIAGMGFTKISSIGSLISVTIYAVYTLLVANLGANVNIMWTADYIYYIVLLVVMIFFYRQKPWLKPIS